MILQNCFDFITVDGAESGIGAAPPYFQTLGMPIEPALIFVNKTQ
jgi:glutamate synthase domain-containing protein 2